MIPDRCCMRGPRLGAFCRVVFFFCSSHFDGDGGSLRNSWPIRKGLFFLEYPPFIGFLVSFVGSFVLNFATGSTG